MIHDLIPRLERREKIFEIERKLMGVKTHLPGATGSKADGENE